MRKYLFGLLFFCFAGSVAAQYNYEVVSASAVKMELVAEPFRLDCWPTGENRYRYSYTIPYSIEPEILLANVFLPDLDVKLNELGYYDSTNIHFLQCDLDLSIAKYENELEINFYTKLNNFDTLGFGKKLLAAIEATPANDSFICDCLPRDIDSLWSDKLQEEVMDLVISKNVMYPTDPFRGYLISFEVNEQGVGLGKYPNDDTTFTLNVYSKFPVVALNGKPVSYKITPFSLYEEYFTQNIETDIANDSDNVLLLDQEQMLYFYDIGYPQMYSRFYESEFGQEYVVKLSPNGRVVSKEMADKMEPALFKREDYNRDGVLDFIHYSDFDDWGTMIKKKYIICMDSVLIVQWYNYTTDFGNGYYEYKRDNMPELRENYDMVGLNKPDSLDEDWRIELFKREFDTYDILITVSKTVTLDQENFNETNKLIYLYNYDVYSLFNPKLNYHGSSKAKGERAIKKILKAIAFYKLHPEKLDSDKRYYE